jgi:hypothetical protein
MLQLVHFVFDLLKPAERRERRFVNRRALFEMNMLREQAKLQAARAHDLAAIRRFFTGDQPKNCRLACAVATDKSNVLARIDLQRCAPQNVLRGKRFVNVRKSEQHFKNGLERKRPAPVMVADCKIAREPLALQSDTRNGCKP